MMVEMMMMIDDGGEEKCKLIWGSRKEKRSSKWHVRPRSRQGIIGFLPRMSFWPCFLFFYDFTSVHFVELLTSWLGCCASILPLLYIVHRRHSSSPMRFYFQQIFNSVQCRSLISPTKHENDQSLLWIPMEKLRGSYTMKKKEYTTSWLLHIKSNPLLGTPPFFFSLST